LSSSTNGPLPAPILISACCDDIISALADRPGASEAARLAIARGSMSLILSFLPQDVLQMMLAGQAVLFNRLAADGARDVLRGMKDTLKLRAQTNVTNMGRLTAKHLDTLIRLQDRHAAPEVTATVEVELASPSAQGANEAPETQPLPAAPIHSETPAAARPRQKPAPQEAPAHAEPPALATPPRALLATAEDRDQNVWTRDGEPFSWLDEPHVEHVTEAAACDGKAGTGLGDIAPASETFDTDALLPAEG
jgi:hypothetical protein